LRFFRNLGRSLEQRWRARGYDDEAFGEIAERVLTEARAHRRVTPTEVIGWVQKAPELPAQFDPTGRFGQPPITVYRGSRFVVDVLYWVDGTTTIHSHAFSGAFQVMSGSSVHGVYTFDLEEAVSSWFRTGRTRLREIELLQEGAVRRIVAGNRFVHSLFHLDRPSVSIVARTAHDIGSGPQYHYASHFEMASFLGDQRTELRIRSLDVLREIDPRACWRHLNRAVTELDLHGAYEAISRLVPVENRERLEQVLAVARRHHGSPVDSFLPALIERHRQHRIMERRRHVRSGEHRFFLALLLNAPNRRLILRLVKERFPHANPVDTVMKWVRELASLPSPIDDGEPNVLGLLLNETELRIFEETLRRRQGPSLIRSLSREYDREDVVDMRHEIDRLQQAFRSYSLFRTLFAD
jgi:hypothetical protein